MSPHSVIGTAALTVGPPVWQSVWQPAEVSDVRWMFHATAMAAGYEEIFEPMARLFGCRVLHRQQLPEPVGRDGGMTWLGDNAIELGAPFGEGSSVATFVERLGGGMHSVAVQVADLDATLARLAPLGVEISARISPEIVFTRPGATAGLVLEWAAHVQDDDPRWGAPTPPLTAAPVVDVERMAFVGAIVRDPARDGERLAEVLDTRLVTYAHGGAPDVAHCALDLGDCMLALFPVPSDPSISRAIWGGAYDRPRCLALGLTVPDQGVAEGALARAGVPVAHRAGDGRAVFVEGLPFPVVLGERLLPGDPRTVRDEPEPAPRRNDDQP